MCNFVFCSLAIKEFVYFSLKCSSVLKTYLEELWTILPKRISCFNKLIKEIHLWFFFQNFLFARIESLWSWIISLANAKDFGHKIYWFWDFQNFDAHLNTNSWLNIGKKILCLIINLLNIILQNAFSEASFRTVILKGFYEGLDGV